MSETILRFGVEIPEELIPDNHFAALLFENLDFFVNHELVTSKSSDSDYSCSNYVFIRDGFNESAILSNGVTEGYFETLNLDRNNYIKDDGTVSMGGRMHIEKKRKSAIEVTREGVKYYQYWFSTPINHGLARQDKPLPAGKFIFRDKISFIDIRDSIAADIQSCKKFKESYSNITREERQTFCVP